MSFLPEDELKGKGSYSMAPMIDFLFILLLFFASLAVTRTTTKNTSIELVEIKPESTATTAATDDSALKVIQIAIDHRGQYKWSIGTHVYDIDSPEALTKELLQQYQKGFLPEDKSQTQLLLTIDKKAHWESILQAIFAIRDAGFDVYPVYQPSDVPESSITADAKSP
jgi:biopolymer transport protein ExbD